LEVAEISWFASCVNRYVHVWKATKLGYQSRCLLILLNVQPGGHKNTTVFFIMQVTDHLQENTVWDKASAYLIMMKSNSDENISGSEILMCFVRKPYVFIVLDHKICFLWKVAKTCRHTSILDTLDNCNGYWPFHVCTCIELFVKNITCKLMNISVRFSASWSLMTMLKFYRMQSCEENNQENDSILYQRWEKEETGGAVEGECNHDCAWFLLAHLVNMYW